MDPIANMAEQVQLANDIIAPPATDYGTDRDPDLEANAVRLAELVLAMDTWRRSGGFDPYASAGS